MRMCSYPSKMNILTSAKCIVAGYGQHLLELGCFDGSAGSEKVEFQLSEGFTRHGLQVFTSFWCGDLRG